MDVPSGKQPSQRIASDGDVVHAELVFTATNFLGSGGAGVSSLGPLSCPANERPIAFVFDDSSSSADACRYAVSQWATAVVSLDHAYLCEDYLIFLEGCGDKSWVDAEAPCGEFEARDCACGGATQNSFQTLLSAFGPSCAE